jgi:hypothetical protein
MNQFFFFFFSFMKIQGSIQNNVVNTILETVSVYLRGQNILIPVRVDLFIFLHINKRVM